VDDVCAMQAFVIMEGSRELRVPKSDANV